MRITIAVLALLCATPMLLASEQPINEPMIDGPLIDVMVLLNAAPQKQNHGASVALAHAVARDFGIKPKHLYGSALVGFAASVPENQIDALRADARIKGVERDRPLHGDGKPGGGGGGQTTPWGVSKINAAGAANTGSGIHVFVVDSGIDETHPDLAAQIEDGYAVQPCFGRSCTSDWDDDQGHGSHVSGIIAAINDASGVVGVAPGVRLHAVKVLDRFNNTTAAKVAAGLDYVTERTNALGVVTVANVSIGGQGSKNGSCSSAGYSGSDAYYAAFCNAARAGVVIAVSAGNYYMDARDFLPSTYDDAVIAVSASDSNDDFWPYSNWGDETAGWTANASAPVAIAAPGVNIYSCDKNGGYTTMSGTSMAAPHVSGAIALLLKKISVQRNYSAWQSVRSELLLHAAPTSNSTSYPHAEDRVDVTAWR